MSTAIWGIIAVLVIGTAIVGYGWWSDRETNRRREAALALPPERDIPGFRPEPVNPEYLSELQASVRPEGLAATELSTDARHELTERLKGSPSFPAGWTSRAFITDRTTGWCVLPEPLVLVCADELADFRELLPALRHAKASGRALVIVSPDATSAVDATLRANMVQGTQSCLLVLLADPGLRRSLCSLTGADLIPADDLRAGFLPEDSLGTCRTWISDEDDSWVILENS
ncbi:MAG: hypothetical protein IPO80_07915 [Propionibacteriaceae bacterium]|nr:hypothetical protein [Propionibacteriaceae bacterium]